MSSAAEVDRLSAVLVTDGVSIAFPPELYRARHKAERELVRWSQALEAVATSPGISPFPGRREVGDYWVRLVETEGGAKSTTALWVCTYWTAHGFPDPEAFVVQGRTRARDWVRRPVNGHSPASWESREWSEIATFGEGDSEEVAEAHLAKVVD